MKELNWLKLITLFICSSYKLMSLSFTPVWKFYYCQNNRHEIAVAIYLFHTRVPEVSEVPGPGPGSHFSAMSFSLGYQTFQDKVTLIISGWFFSVKKTQLYLMLLRASQLLVCFHILILFSKVLFISKWILHKTCSNVSSKASCNFML